MGKVVEHLCICTSRHRYNDMDSGGSRLQNGFSEQRDGSKEAMTYPVVEHWGWLARLSSASRRP